MSLMWHEYFISLFLYFCCKYKNWALNVPGYGCIIYESGEYKMGTLQVVCPLSGTRKTQNLSAVCPCVLEVQQAVDPVREVCQGQKWWPCWLPSLSQSVFHFLLCCFHVVIQLEEVSNILHTEARQNKLVFVTCYPKRVLVRSWNKVCAQLSFQYVFKQHVHHASRYGCYLQSHTASW